MKTPYLLTVLAASIALSGCSTGKKPAELALEPQSQYDQRYQDGLALSVTQRRKFSINAR